MKNFFPSPKFILQALKILISLFIVILLIKKSIFVVPSGHAGIRYSIFTGTETHKVYNEGLNFKFPLDHVYFYDLSKQKLDNQQKVLSKEGMNIEIEYSILFHVEPKNLPQLHLLYGSNYINGYIKPITASWMRKTFAVMSPIDIFQKQDGVIEMVSKNHLNTDIGQKYFQITGVYIKKIGLPQKIEESVENTYVAQQKSKEYDYLITNEGLEMKRKDIEAQGIRNFRNISGVDPVKWKALDVKREIISSPKTKIIVTDGGVKTPSVEIKE